MRLARAGPVHSRRGFAHHPDMRCLLTFLFSSLLFPLLAQEPEAPDEECTIGVASGKATADGRPLLWKNRDSHHRDNVVMALADGGKHAYFALCDAGKPEFVWGGANGKGFAVVNAVARDLPQGADQGPGNGGFMKRALQQCATVAEFEQLLRDTNDNGRRTRANFAVVDAHGAAAIFEAGHRTYTRFDAAAGKGGLLLRTNFAVTGSGERGKERCERATALCNSAAALPLTPRFLLQQLLRDVQPPANAAKGAPGLLDVRETIHRQTTVAALVVHGVKSGEDPSLLTMWSLLGQPLFTVAVPLWPAAGTVPRELSGTPRSDLCEASCRLQDAMYDSAPSAAEAGEEAAEAEASGPIRWLRSEPMAHVRRALLFHEAKVLGDYESSFARFRAAGKAPPAVLRAAQEGIARDALKWVREQADQHAAAPAGK